MPKKATLFIKLQRAVAINYIISDIRLCGLFFALVARILDLLLKLQFVVIIYLFICHIGDCYLVCSAVCVDMCLQLALATERGNTCCIGIRAFGGRLRRAAALSRAINFAFLCFFKTTLLFFFFVGFLCSCVFMRLVYFRIAQN